MNNEYIIKIFDTMYEFPDGRLLCYNWFTDGWQWRAHRGIGTQDLPNVDFQKEINGYKILNK